MTTSAQEILKTGGYATRDNRSPRWKSMNKALNFGVILSVAPIGKVWVINGKESDLRLRWKKPNGNFFTRYYAAKLSFFNTYDKKRISQPHYIIGSTVLNIINDFREDLEKAGLLTKEDLIIDGYRTEECGKCDGRGHIPSFAHICKGVCFDCMGLGYKVFKINREI